MIVVIIWVCFGTNPVLANSNKEILSVERLIHRYSIEYSEKYNSPFSDVYFMSLDIAWSESRFDSKAKNPNSSASGIFQFIKSTWKENCDGDVINKEDNIKCGVRMIAQGKYHHWLASFHFWKNLPYSRLVSGKFATLWGIGEKFVLFS